MSNPRGGGSVTPFLVVLHLGRIDERKELADLVACSSSHCSSSHRAERFGRREPRRPQRRVEVGRITAAASPSATSPLSVATGSSARRGDPAAWASHGFHQLVTYQPASRFWAFQGIEAAFFVVLAALLIAVAYRMVLRRDA